jgi:hypothetical protein
MKRGEIRVVGKVLGTGLASGGDGGVGGRGPVVALPASHGVATPHKGGVDSTRSCRRNALSLLGRNGEGGRTLSVAQLEAQRALPAALRLL